MGTINKIEYFRLIKRLKERLKVLSTTQIGTRPLGNREIHLNIDDLVVEIAGTYCDLDRVIHKLNVIRNERQDKY
jgi:hypothetical protein